MKRTLLIMTMVASAIVSMAQKGSWYVGGVVGFASYSSKAPNGFTSTSSLWAFAPEAGTFLRDDIQLGVALGLGGTSQKNDNQSLSSSTNFNPTVYSRKFFKITDNLSTFAGLYLSVISGSATNNTGAPNTSQFGFGAKLGIGIAYALSPRFTAVGQYGLMGFQTVNNKVGGNDNGTDTSFNFGVNTVGNSSLPQGNGSSAFNIGVYYTFKKAQ